MEGWVEVQCMDFRCLAIISSLPWDIYFEKKKKVSDLNKMKSFLVETKAKKLQTIPSLVPLSPKRLR